MTSTPKPLISEPHFSIIIPARNAALYLECCLNSLLEQTYPHWEVIVVENGSTDETLSLAMSFEDTRIRVFSIPGRGVSNARNFGIGQSKEDFLIFLDADDWLAADALQVMAKSIISHYDDAIAWVGGYLFVDSNGTEISELRHAADITLGQIVQSNLVENGGQVAILRSAALAVNGFS